MPVKHQNRFPKGWDARRVQEVIAHYEGQSEEEAVAEDEPVAEDENLAMLYVPRELVPAVEKLIAEHEKG